MPSTLANFTLSAAAAPDDFIVGYDEAVLNGERRWSVSTIANAVSGIMNAQLDADIANATNVTVLSASLSASPTSAKAWVNFDGTGTIGASQTIRSSYNVSSVTKNGTGDYTVNFTTAMADANYSVLNGTSTTSNPRTNAANIKNTVAPTTSSVTLYSTEYNGAAFVPVDLNIICIAIFGN